VITPAEELANDLHHALELVEAERDEAIERYRLAHIDWANEAAQTLQLIAEVRALREERIKEQAGTAVLLWLGGIALAAAGGVGAVAAKLSGWIVVTK